MRFSSVCIVQFKVPWMWFREKEGEKKIRVCEKDWEREEVRETNSGGKKRLTLIS